MSVEVTWNELINFIGNKNVSIQYIESDTEYKVFAFDGSFSVELKIPKTVPENETQKEFENNWKNNISVNDYTIQKVSQTVVEDKKFILDINALSFNASVNSTTTYDFPLNNDYLFKGLTFISPSANFGDYLEVDIIDKNNVTGNGANYIFSSPIKRQYVQETTNSGPIMCQNIIAYKIPAPGLFMRIRYRNTSILTQVSVYINLQLYNRII